MTVPGGSKRWRWAFNEIGLFNTSQAAEGLTRDPGGNQIGTRLERLEALVAGERA